MNSKTTEKKFLPFIWAFIAVILINGCSGPSAVLGQQSWAERTLASLTLREKIGQMMLYGMHMKFMNAEDARWKEITRVIQQDGVGGIHIWYGETGASLTMLNELQRMSRIPIIVDADIEYGLNQRYKAGTDLPPLMAIAATGDPNLAYEAGRISAMEAGAVGIHWNFSPVTDINNNPANPIINTRSFGETAEIVNKFSVEYIRGLKDHGMLSTAKHFPGHGDTETDSHSSLASIPSDSARIWSVEIEPFRHAIANGVDAVMVAHVTAPDYQPNADLPATLSPYWVTDVLKGELGFDGVVVTDAMGMGGITKNYSNDYGLIHAINAGCNFIIQAQNVTKAIDVVEKAVREGIIDLSRIDESALKMLRMKEKIGLHEKRTIDLSYAQKTLGLSKNKKIASQIAEQSLTLVKNENNVIPLDTGSSDAWVLIDMYDSPNNHSESTMSRLIRQSGKKVIQFQIDESDSSDYLQSVMNQIVPDQMVILNVFASPKAHKDRIGLPDAEADFVRNLTKKSENLIMVSFGNPYLIQDFPDVPAYLCAYKGNSVLQSAAAKALLGKNAINGKLPITIPGVAEMGFGIQIEPSRTPIAKSTAKPGTQLKQAMPYEIGADATELRRLMQSAVEDSAWPGGVLLAAKDGIIFFHEAFGYHTYDKKNQVHPSDIFDLASLTKVIGTTSGIMKLADQNKLKLDDRVIQHQDNFYDPGKTNTTIRHLLSHTSGLPPFKKFYRQKAQWDDVIATEVESGPGKKTRYSDIGFMILGKIIEETSGSTLDTFLTNEIFEPLGMTETGFNPSISKLHRILPTEIDANGDAVHGVVHDENARYFGGVTGHAGIFSTARDLAVFSQMMLNSGLYGWKRIFREGTVSEFTSKAGIIPGSSRCLGWDSPSDSSSGGVFLSDSSFGHTGFTGTSLWIDPENEMIVILLTNAVHPYRSRKNPKYYDWQHQLNSAAYRAVGLSEQNPNLLLRNRWQTHNPN